MITEQVPRLLQDILFEPRKRLAKDVIAAVRNLNINEVRFLVDGYYMMQENRKRSANQALAMERTEEPNDALRWFVEANSHLEHSVWKMLNAFVKGPAVCRWAMEVPGIGPVLAAGLYAHIDIAKAPTVGHIWRFAGLDPTAKWGKGQRRPWNARLKTLCWKIGESFVKVSNLEGDIYGKVYKERKALEIARNESKAFADQAKAILANKKIGKKTEAYKWYSKGKLPPAHIHSRAKRYAVKLFLSHYQYVAYSVAYGKAPPLPYILTQPQHTHFIAPPKFVP